jgi:hypothetical protein
MTDNTIGNDDGGYRRQQAERREAIRDRRLVAELYLAHIGRLRDDLERASGAFDRARAAFRKAEDKGDVRLIDAARDGFWQAADAFDRISARGHFVISGGKPSL